MKNILEKYGCLLYTYTYYLQKPVESVRTDRESVLYYDYHILIRNDGPREDCYGTRALFGVAL